MGKKERGAEANVFQAKIFNTSNNTEEAVERERMSGEIAVLPLKSFLLVFNTYERSCAWCSRLNSQITHSRCLWSG